jgi:hypothetical protein
MGLYALLGDCMARQLGKGSEPCSGKPAMSAPAWKSRTTKLQTYGALYLLNRCFEATLLSFERLEQLRLFRPEYLNEYILILERLRLERLLEPTKS